MAARFDTFDSFRQLLLSIQSPPGFRSRHNQLERHKSRRARGSGSVETLRGLLRWPPGLDGRRSADIARTKSFPRLPASEPSQDLVSGYKGVPQMCDYSLEMYASRPARQSEKYVTTRFPSGSIGLATPGDYSTAVCVQYDTHLTLEGISTDLQMRLGVKSSEEVVFARLQHGAYRDGIMFANGKKISLQLLGLGVSIALAKVREERKVVGHRGNILELIS
jgi:hypothetical protein